MIWTILLLIGAHCIADYPLQGEFLANFKGKFDYLLLMHSIIWGTVIAITLKYLGLYADWKFIFLIAGHFIIDRWKARKEDKTDALTWDLWIDQLLHALQLAICLL